MSESDFCNACGVDVRKYKKIMYAANSFYNDGLARARVRDLSGAIKSLKQCLKFNKNHIDARNLLGLIYFEMGEAVEGVSEWVISKNIRSEKNIADDYLNMIQSNQGRLETITTTIKKFNKALDLCHQQSPDLAVIQLKKVLSLNPKYVKAHQLLALLYIEQEEFEKARRELERAAAIDDGSVITKSYMSEVELALHPEDEKPGKRKKNRNNNNFSQTQTFMSGNEVIIQPLNDKDNYGLSLFLHIAIGIIIGLCATYFIIVPARVSSVKNDKNEEITSYGEQIEKKNAEIEDLNARIAGLEESNIELQNKMSGATGNGGSEEYNNLIEAAYAYMDPNQTDVMVEQYLGLISSEYVENDASTEFVELYRYLISAIGGTVGDSYCDSGVEAYGQMNYSSAIASLSKAYQYDPNNEKALYYLALSYYDSGDVNTAKSYFYELQSKFPSGDYYDQATRKLEELGE